jgi:hypothetical protein
MYVRDKSKKQIYSQSEDVYRKTDNTMAKRKTTNNDLQNTAQKTVD